MLNKKVIIITPKTYSGGAEHVAARLSKHLNETYDVSVISFDCEKRDYFFAGELIDLELPAGQGLLKRLAILLKASFSIRDYKKSLEPVACISLIGHPNLANVFSKRNEFCVVSVRTYMRRSPSVIKHFFQKQLVKRVYNKADKVIAICEGVSQDLINHYGVDSAKVEVIYPYFDVAAIQKKCRDLIEPEWHNVFSKPVIITAGRLTYDKGQWHLIKAFSLIKDKIPDAVLVILGRGDMEDELKALANKMNDSEDIHFMGYRDNPFKYIHAASVFAFPSLIEGFGNALGEALACSTPVVAADCQVGPREILAPISMSKPRGTGIEQHLVGYLVPAFDHECNLKAIEPVGNEVLMADAIVSILGDSSLRSAMSIEALSRAKDFDVSIVSKQWDAILEKLV